MVFADHIGAKHIARFATGNGDCNQRVYDVYFRPSFIVCNYMINGKTTGSSTTKCPPQAGAVVFEKEC